MPLRLFNRKQQTASLPATGVPLDARVTATTEWQARRIRAETTRKQHRRIRMMSHDMQSVRQVAGSHPYHGNPAKLRLCECECARAGAVRCALPGTAASTDRRAGSADGRLAYDRALRGGHRLYPSRRVQFPVRPARVARVDAAQAQHGHCGQGVHPPGLGGGGRDHDIALLASPRCCGAWRCVPVGRPERTPGDGPPKRNQPAAGSTPKVSSPPGERFRTRRWRHGMAWQGGEPGCRPARFFTSGPAPMGGECRATYG